MFRCSEHPVSRSDRFPAQSRINFPALSSFRAGRRSGYSCNSRRMALTTPIPTLRTTTSPRFHSSRCMRFAGRNGCAPQSACQPFGCSMGTATTPACFCNRRLAAVTEFSWRASQRDPCCRALDRRRGSTRYSSDPSRTDKCVASTQINVDKNSRRRLRMLP